MSRIDIDTVSLEAASSIIHAADEMAFPGGDAQLKAHIQCIVYDAIHCANTKDSAAQPIVDLTDDRAATLEQAASHAEYQGSASLDHSDEYMRGYMRGRNDAAVCVRSLANTAQGKPAGYVLVPVEPTEAMIQAACLQQSTEKFATYQEWWDSLQSGTSRFIREIVVDDYKAMIDAALQSAGDNGEMSPKSVSGTSLHAICDGGKCGVGGYCRYCPAGDNGEKTA